MTGDRRVRVHIIGVVVTALFCSLLARMWFLQVRETPTAIHMAGQSSRTIRTPTSRGLIYDSAGRLLVGNRLAWAISGDAVLRAAAHDSPERKIVPGIAKLVGMTERDVTVALDKKFVGPLESVVLKTGINEAVRIQLVEHADEYPHVQLAAIASRWYADPGIAPQVLGYLGRVNEDDLKKHSEYGRNEVIGRSGLEAVYESLLRGDPSSFDVQVDARGLVVGDPIHSYVGRPGYDINLTIDADLQKFAQDSLQRGIETAAGQVDEDLSGKFNFHYRANGGTVLVLDTTDGSVKAMVSSPTFPNSGDIGARFDELSSKEKHNPLLNRATAELYAPGSTFKLISAIAAWQTGTYSESQQVDQRDGCIHLPGFDKCSPDKGGGTVDFRRALTISSDVYFYDAGKALWDKWKQHDVQSGYAIQNVARSFGFGNISGVDVTEVKGRVPDAEWTLAAAKAEWLSKPHPSQTDKDNFAAFKSWQPGANINLAVGQGDLLVSPLQLANAYAALANGGNVYRPRLVASVTDDRRRKVADPAIDPKVNSTVQLDDRLRSALLDGFWGVVNDTHGTAYQAFRNFPASFGVVRGKTGTAQRGFGSKDKCVKIVQGVPNFDRCIGDTSWFVSMYAPPGSDTLHPRYVVLAMVEEGGRGGRIAAPIVRQIIEHMNHAANITPIPNLAPGTVAGNKKG